MTRSKIAPQAYTKETLSKAYAWLTSQPLALQEQATSADVLVSIYLRAKRHGEKSLSPLKPTSKIINESAPVSMKHFQNDLKDLATGLKQFDSEAELQIEQPPERLANPIVPTAITTNYEAKVTERVLEVKAEFQPSQSLDAKSQQIVQSIQKRFNLSSETEAIRMLITLGHEQINKSFPES